jgi:hypothetical protein
MGKAISLNGRDLGKYPVAESEDHGHFGRKIAIGTGLLGAAAAAFMGYKALTNDSPKNTATEVQKALSDPKAQTLVVENPREYRERALAEFNETGRVPDESRTAYGHALPQIGFQLSDYLNAMNDYLRLSPKLGQINASEISSVEKISRRDFERFLRNYKMTKEHCQKLYGEIYVVSVLSDKNPTAEGKYFARIENDKIDIITKKPAGFNSIGKN